ncbi:lasso peptide biosynthesis B2 protein [Salinadaptatus halalkaliphilus]|uniref:Lasso peptide biosynthesis B2 protein n=1 Tax=Salinadaptatus halalkaliphilus TaxID=2419781 RepID=A0A4S3TPP6_9EURY|nr:lasso peptide biosynthesis B2 protein [Salinadaptatus halalkaliphilus]THE65155.1 lasso peptide biosynthesis B2 protein [Salinadaptatus halalkaliphilus]
MGRISGFLSVPAGDKLRLVLAATLLVVVRIGVFVVPFSTFRRLLLAPATTLARIVPGSPAPVRIAWTVDAADRNCPGHRTCLMRSLTAETMHRLYDHAVVHRIGVDTASDGNDTAAGSGCFQAHSWIEYDGSVLIGHLEDLSRFEPLPPLDEIGGP